MTAETELRVAIQLTNVRQLRGITNELERIGGTRRGIRGVGRSAQDAGQEIQDMGRFAKFTLNVLEAFLLYKGFVFLKTQAQEFTRELVNLEHQVGIIQTQLGDVPENFQPLIRSEIIDTAEATGASLETLSEAQFSIVSANIELQKSFQVLDAVTKATVAGGLTDVNTSVESVLTQMNAFGLEAEDTTMILDKQFNLVRRGIFTYEQFARVSGMVSVAFAGIGQSIETANAALATVSQIFTGNQLRFGATALRNLAASLGKNTEEFEELGVAVFDQEGDFRNFIDIMRDLEAQLDGLTEAQRTEALRSIFPNKRELRGALALLGRLDTLEQFFVEQQFAVGDLDKAYETVNESLKTQAQILRNELIPAVEPVLLLMRDLLNVVNTLNDAVPGFTRSLLQAGAAFAAVKAAGLASASAGGMGVSRTNPMTALAFNPVFGGALPGGPRRAGGRVASMFSRRPTGLGLALGAGVGATVFESGRRSEPGFDQAGLLGALATGGATGAVLGGGAPGAIAGAAISGGLFALGEAFEEEAPKTAEAWNERFREGVLDEGQTIGQALSNTIASQVTEEGGQDLASRVRDIVLEPLTFEELERRPTMGGFGAAPGTLGELQRTFGPLLGFENAGTQLVNVGEREVDLRGEIVNAIAEAEAQDTEIQALAATGAASEDTIRREVIEVAFEDFIQGLGTLNDENQAQIETARNVVDILSNFGVTSSEAMNALDILVNDGLEAFLNALEDAAVADLPAFRETIADFNNQIAFDADAVSSALSELGLETAQVGESFGELTRTMQAFEFIELFRQGGLITEGQAAQLSAQAAGAATFPGFGGSGPPTEFTPQMVDQVSSQLVAFIRGELENAEEPLEAFGLQTTNLGQTMGDAATNIEEGVAPVLTLGSTISFTVNELRGFAENFREFNQRIQTIQLIEEVLALQDALNLTDAETERLNDAIVILAEEALGAADSSFLQGTPEDIADFFLQLVQAQAAEAPEEPEEPEIPGQTQLDQALRDTATAFEQGLLTSANFTADELRAMGDDLSIFNKQLRKVKILEEIGRVAELAGESINLTSTIQSLIQRLSIGGETLASLIEDPERLADLIATAEFREVNLDQSTQNTFTIRVSTDADPRRATELADSIMREINNATQDQVPP